MKSFRCEIGVADSAAKLAKLSFRLKAASRFAHSPLPSLWFLTDEARTPDPLAAASALPAGTGVILRHYRAFDREAIARELMGLARERNLTVLVGADAALARNVGAHGVHFPHWALRRRAGPAPRGLITASAHSLSAARAAHAFGVHAIFFGPVFSTKSHDGAPGLEAVRFSALAHSSLLPVIALGGINVGSAVRLLGSGAAGLGAIGALLPPTDQEAR